MLWCQGKWQSAFFLISCFSAARVAAAAAAASTACPAFSKPQNTPCSAPWCLFKLFSWKKKYILILTNQWLLQITPPPPHPLHCSSSCSFIQTATTLCMQIYLRGFLKSLLFLLSLIKMPPPQHTSATVPWELKNNSSDRPTPANIITVYF